MHQGGRDALPRVAGVFGGYWPGGVTPVDTLANRVTLGGVRFMAAPSGGANCGLPDDLAGVSTASGDEVMLEDMRGTIFRQTQFAEFDLAAHTLAEKGEPMTAEVLMKMCREQYPRYYGPDFAVDPELDVECIRIPHYYRGYYVYRYADSYCAAAAIAKRILAGEPGARDQWMKFLKTGNSMYAIDMLKVAGVDMTTPKPIEEAMALFEQLLKDLEELLKT